MVVLGLLPHAPGSGRRAKASEVTAETANLVLARFSCWKQEMCRIGAKVHAIVWLRLSRLPRGRRNPLQHDGLFVESTAPQIAQPRKSTA